MRHDIGDRLPVYRESHRHPGLDRIDHLTCAISQIPHTHLHVRQRGTVTFPSPSPPRLTVRPLLARQRDADRVLRVDQMARSSGGLGDRELHALDPPVERVTPRGIVG